jgi:protein NrfD
MESKITYDIFHLMYWDWRVVLDFFLGGIAVGAFLYAIGLMFYRKDDQLVSVKVGSIAGPIAMIAALSFLLAEMGHPTQIYKTFTGFNFTSTMSWGGAIQICFIILSIVFVAFLFCNISKTVRWHVGMIAGFFALFVTVYQGFLLSFVTARPLWNAGAVSIISIFLSFNTGVATVLLVTCFSKRVRNEMREIVSAQGNSLDYVVKYFMLISLLVQLTTCFIWIVSLITGKADSVKAYYILMNNYGYHFWIGVIGVGLIAPFIILAVWCSGKLKDSPIPIFVTIPILVGGYFFRYILILAGQLS